MGGKGRAQPSENAEDQQQPAAAWGGKGRAQPSENAEHHQQPAAKRPPHAPAAAVQTASGEKRKREDTVLEDQMRKHEAIALVLQNIRSFRELGLDTAALESDLQALTEQQAAGSLPGAAGGPEVRMDWVEATVEGKAREKVKASEKPSEIVGLMKKHVGAEGVQEAGCEALGNICRTSTASQRCELVRVKVARLGGIEAVLAGMGAHVDAAGVQKAGCEALRILCENNKAITVEVAPLGVIEAVLTGMRAHAGAAGVQEAGCRALGRLSRNADNQVKVAGLGGIEAVVAGMRAHAGGAVQQNGCEALYTTLCLHDDEGVKVNAGNVERMKALGTVQGAVESAIAAHPSNSNVQRLGRQVLGKLA
ncbi:hypothetical protein T484DRAFT_3607931 [Baffinella frigidus]|nr:hypothetical protein T484DRAFT_3607931 [Cryptophyta sp. CCMP2293]